jgi:vacuolar-type H+-ATPase subunit F/Vma7
MKLMVVGNPAAVIGFSLVGVDGQAVTNAAEANQALDSILASPGDIGILLVTEDISTMIAARMDSLRMHSTVPLVVEIPAPGGPPEGKPALSEVVKKAIGIKL